MQIVIQKGDTLSALAKKYGTTVQEIMSLNPTVIKDQNRISTGSKINLPDSGSPASVPTPSLEKTLSPEKPVDQEISTIDRQLNTATAQYNPGSLTNFQSVMRMVSDSAYKERQKTELNTMGTLFDPSKVSGSTFGDIIDWVELNRTKDVANIYKTTMETATQQQRELGDYIKDLRTAKDKMQENARQLFTEIATNYPSIFDSLDGEELQALKQGNVPDTVYNKIANSEEAKLKVQKMRSDISNSSGNKQAASASKIQEVQDEMDKAKDPNTGYVDINIYRRLMNENAKEIDETTFENRFSSYLSPQDRAKFGIGKATGVKAVDTGIGAIDPAAISKALEED